MSTTLRFIAGGSIVGLLAAGMLALPSVLPALAKEEPAKTLLGTMHELIPQPIEVDNLVKYDITTEPGVIADVIGTRTIRKISFGRTEFVKIVTTPSGVYSSDGMTSPHFRYPGIHKQWKATPGGSVAFWSGGSWQVLETIDAGSFVLVTPFAGGQLMLSDEGNCVFVKNAAYC